MCGATFIEKTEKNQGQNLNPETILEKIADHNLCQHSILFRTRLTHCLTKSVQHHLTSNHQVAVRQRHPAPWGLTVNWTRGWTGAGLWTMCSGRRSGRLLKDTEMQNNGIELSVIKIN